MKIKKIKLLKALALTGAFGIVATVPVIVSSCSSTSDNNTGGDNNGGGTQTQTITPQIQSAVTLNGALSDIYDTANSSSENTNAKIAEEIKNNLETVFTNGAALSDVSDLEITVSHNFPESTWIGTAYSGDSGWYSAQMDTVLYDYTLNPLTISSLSDLKTQLSDSKIQEIFTAAGTTTTTNATYAVQNALGFTNKNNGAENRDLLHVNVLETVPGQSGGDPTTKNYDLQIPVSDLNLELKDLSVTVKGTNVAETTLTTTLTYNIGINEAQNFTQPTTNPTVQGSDIQNDDANAANKALVALTYATEADGQTTLDNEKISAELGIYNSVFTAVSIKPVDGGNNQYTITLSATPKDGYVWEDGSNTAKQVSFNVTFTVNS
ncbi:hypothetical protein D8X55_05040 [Malacoplasma penetrans]|uniref:P35 lipoprotein homolog n=1 Tax=Malacoplasma penetrans (strain HF-2) TaxID=272633 RepID=Q8EV95_MALP2|nr:P35 family lipoprotein [Malacoplasma penetrans]RXY95965.1 hypothetical protein D8X55_05040 [Malacoplasma penetrans]BAC44463.1 P35 lipoprotein homolog [Malacoplasma penetrans HF-2]